MKPGTEATTFIRLFIKGSGAGRGGGGGEERERERGGMEKHNCFCIDLPRRQMLIILFSFLFFVNPFFFLFENV